MKTITILLFATTVVTIGVVVVPNIKVNIDVPNIQASENSINLPTITNPNGVGKFKDGDVTCYFTRSYGISCLK